MLFTLPTLPQRYSRGGNWSIRESVLIAATNSGSSLHLFDHSALVHRMFCSVVQEKSIIVYSIELLFSLYDQIYVYFVSYTDIRIFLHVLISCLLSVLKWTSPLNSFPSPTPLYLTSRAGRQATVHGRDLRPSSTTSYHLHPLRQHDTPLHKPSIN